MTDDRQRLGLAGETVAAEYLAERGYRVVERRWRAANREIDLVVERDGVVVLVEVKTRRDEPWLHPITAIDRRKRSAIRRAARAALSRWGRYATGFRFDVVTVVWGRGKPQIDHIEDAFRVE